MKVATGLHTCVESAGKECAIGIQPPFSLEKTEKEQSRGVKQCELATLISATANERRAEGVHADLQGAIEAPRKRFAPEYLDPAGMGEHVGVGASVACRAERRKRFGVAVDDASPIGDERCDTRRAAVGRPRRDSDVRRGRLGRDHDPQYMWRA